MPGGIGFYVHHHGRGHANRTRQIIEHLREPITVFGSSVDFLQDLATDRIRIVTLPSDVVSTPDPPPDVLHYAPLGVSGIRERMFLMADWIRRETPDLLVVDVSVEVALLARLMSLPTVVMRQNGLRNDLPHQMAYQSSTGLLAPYSAPLEEPETADWVRKKTYYAGGFSRYGERKLSRTAARSQLGMREDRQHLVVMSGMGGGGNPLKSIHRAAQSYPGWDWWIVGPATTDEHAPLFNFYQVGQVDDTFPYLKGADVVVGSAGNNTVMEVATAAVPYICIPEERPFDEQLTKAAALQRIEAAIVLNNWPEADEWSALLERAKRADTNKLTGMVEPNGAQNCAEYIMRVMTKLKNERR